MSNNTKEKSINWQPEQVTRRCPGECKTLQAQDNKNPRQEPLCKVAWKLTEPRHAARDKFNVTRSLGSLSALNCMSLLWCWTSRWWWRGQGKTNIAHALLK
jgi:hypothetical protein